MSIFNQNDAYSTTNSNPSPEPTTTISYDMYGGEAGSLEPVEDLSEATLVTVPRRNNDRDKELSEQQALAVKEFIGFKGNVSASDSGKSWNIYRSSDGSGYKHELVIPAPTSA